MGAGGRTTGMREDEGFAFADPASLARRLGDLAREREGDRFTVEAVFVDTRRDRNSIGTGG